MTAAYCDSARLILVNRLDPPRYFFSMILCVVL